MLRKFAVALIATTVLAAPALAADPAKSTAAGAAPATPAATATTSGKSDKADVKTIKSDKSAKKVKVSHRHNAHHVVTAKNHKHPAATKTARATKPVNPGDESKGKKAHAAASKPAY